ncbi:MAG: adenylosuccinate synthase [Euryarchaeota archaeon]|nr:adenylosuccinate synthase [Euryarchaeota archaeon]
MNVIIGTQWGDEGKGKVTDFYAKKADVVVRFQGGNNAGHTVIVGDKVYKFHIIPSGSVEEKILILGNGMVVDPEILLDEIESLKKDGKEVSLHISERANLIMPYHKKEDELHEELKGNLKAGSTKRGIGPCYADKIARFGIRFADLIDDEVFREKLSIVLRMKNKIFRAFGKEPLDYDKIYREYCEYREKLRENVADTSLLLDKYRKEGKNILMEGAQGTHLDIDHGIYPYTTSSHTIAGGVSIGAGVPPGEIENILGVVKAYTSRVGTGPVPTELTDDVGKHLQKVGKEFGTTTGRPRRCGWLDLVMVDYSHRINGLTGIALTKLDVLCGLKKVKVGIAYDCNGKRIDAFPANMKTLAKCKPVYKEFDGWELFDKEKIKKEGYKAFPKEAREYMEFITDHLNVPISLISYGPKRSETLVLKEIFL